MWSGGNPESCSETVICSLMPQKSPLAKHPNLCAKVQLDNVGVQSHCLSSCDPDSIGRNLCSIFETSDGAAVWWLNRSSWVSFKKYRGIILRVEYGDECSQDFEIVHKWIMRLTFCSRKLVELCGASERRQDARQPKKKLIIKGCVVLRSALGYVTVN